MRIGRRRVQSSGPEDPVWIWHIIIYVEQRLLTIRFSPAIRFSLAIRFYKPTSGVIVNDNKYWLSPNSYGIWILEHKGATTLQVAGGGGKFRRSSNRGPEAPEI